MGSESGEPDSVVTEQPVPAQLRDHPRQFSFFQAVRLLQRAAGVRDPIGSFRAPSEEAVRLAANPSLTFPASEIEMLEPADRSGKLRHDKPMKMTVNFFGLVGHSGVLPTRYSELIAERRYARDTTMRDFLDIFNHRLTSLLYRAWEKYRFPVPYERGGEEPFTGYLLDLLGLGTPGLANRQPVPDRALICYEGLFAQFPHSAVAFRLMLEHYFEVPVEVVPFSGTWRPLDGGSRTCLMDTRTSSEQLGIGIVLGDEVWDQESVVRVRLGPMGLEQYKDFLPDGTAFEPLKGLVKFFCGEDLDVEVQLILKREEAPRFALDSEEVPPPRLGWFSWMFTRPLGRDPDETVLRLWDD